MKIATILDQIDLGSIALPGFRGICLEPGPGAQPDAVPLSPVSHQEPRYGFPGWKRYRQGDNTPAPGVVKLCSTASMDDFFVRHYRGKPPRFFDGNAQATGLYFHLEDETFEFYIPSKMKDNPLWVNVTG